MVTQTAGVAGQAATQTLTPTPQASIGKDAFLGLLVAQMQHQNPLQPQADGEFLAQLAQFSSLEQLQDISADMNALLELFRTALEQGAAPTGTTQGGM